MEAAPDSLQQLALRGMQQAGWRQKQPGVQRRPQRERVPGPTHQAELRRTPKGEQPQPEQAQRATELRPEQQR
jgi:hypothetical protein